MAVVGSAPFPVPGRGVNALQGCSVQGVPGLRALLSRPCGRSFAARVQVGATPYRVWWGEGGGKDPCHVCRGVWCLPTARHGWELASSRR